MGHEQGLLTVSQVAQRLKLSPQHVRNLINSSKLAAQKIGSQWLVRPSDLAAYAARDDVVIDPDDRMRETSELPDVVALSFFSGAMGLDAGLAKAGIHPLLACENNKFCRQTIVSNVPGIALIGNIYDYEPAQMLEYARVPSDRTIDLIVGGPPCQAFSTAGAQRGFDDERGNVFLRYLDIVDALKPTYVVTENVRGLLSAVHPIEEGGDPVRGGALRMILERLRESGYTTTFELYNAANFGAPQKRERVILISKLGNERVPYLTPTHDVEGRWGLARWRTLKDALDAADIPEHHYVEFPEKRLRYYRMLTAGQYWRNLPEDVQAEAMGKSYALSGGRTGFYRRLSFDEPSPTLVTNPTMPATDLCHPEELRPLSVEEYAAIQEFSATWRVAGSLLEQYRQLGNAVPTRLGEAIGKTLLADMAGEALPAYEGFPYSRYRHTSDLTWESPSAS